MNVAYRVEHACRSAAAALHAGSILLAIVDPSWRRDCRPSRRLARFRRCLLARPSPHRRLHQLDRYPARGSASVSTPHERDLLLIGAGIGAR